MANEIDTTAGLFFEAGRRIRRCIDRGDAPLSFTQFETLRFIYEAKRPSMRELAKHLEITAPSATSLTSDLVRRGYVRREVDTADRRQVRLCATITGVKAVHATTATRKRVLTEILLTLSEKDHRDMQRILLKMTSE